MLCDRVKTRNPGTVPIFVSTKMGLSPLTRLAGLGGLTLLVGVLGGCGPELSKSELGDVQFDVPKVAGADKPYPMPKLGTADEKNDEHLRRPIPHSTVLGGAKRS